MNETAVRLDAGLDQLGLGDTTPEQRQMLLAYLDLLEHWGRVYNLTSIRDPLQMVGLHLLDSLAVLPWLDDATVEGASVLDMGSGAGLPGVPLAILRPGLEFTLNDAVGKKAAFMRQAAMELGLGHVSVIHGRIESLARHHWLVVLARALAPLPQLVTLAGPRLTPGGSLLALKANLTEAEHVSSMTVAEVSVPFVEGPRQIVRVDFSGRGGVDNTDQKR